MLQQLIVFTFLEHSEPEVIDESDQIVTQITSTKKCKKAKKKKNK